MVTNPHDADLFPWPKSGLPALVNRVGGGGGQGLCVCLCVCVCVLQTPSEVDSCQGCSSTLRQGLTKRLNTALGFPASMG